MTAKYIVILLKNYLIIPSVDAASTWTSCQPLRANRNMEASTSLPARQGDVEIAEHVPAMEIEMPARDEAGEAEAGASQGTSLPI